MTNATYASIIPLIGGETIGMQNVFGKRPEYIVSYTPFKNHDAQLLNYYGNEVPYYLIDQAVGSPSYKKVDVVNSVCPCAGLSSLSGKASGNNPANKWMVESSKFVLQNIGPKVLWGENAPALATRMGEPVVNQLRQLASEYGYTFSLYKTKSLLHGLSQIRNRSFYFFWKGDVIPHLPYFNRPNEKIEDTIINAFVSKDDPMNECINKRTPSEHGIYAYIRKVMHPEMSHSDFQKSLTRTTNVLDYVESKGVKYNIIGDWLREFGDVQTANFCGRVYAKLEAGKNIMRRGAMVPKDYIGAFVSNYPWDLTHPVEDRYITVREALAIMKMPGDFMLQGDIGKNINKVCQNVPVTTAADMASGILDYLNGKLDTVNSDFMIQNNHNQTEEVSTGKSLTTFME